MNGLIGEFRIGEDIAIALDVTAGDATGATGLVAMMKPALSMGNRFVLDEAASGIPMAVAPQQPASAGWIVTLDHSLTSNLSAGTYGIDAKLVIASGVSITGQTAFIRLSRAAVA